MYTIFLTTRFPPQMMQQMMDNMMSNPEMMEMVMNMNPQLRDLVERNPEIRSVRPRSDRIAMKTIIEWRSLYLTVFFAECRIAALALEIVRLAVPSSREGMTQYCLPAESTEG